MSNAQEHPQEHQSFIRTPRQLIVLTVFAFVVPVVVILMLAGYVARGTRGADGSEAYTAQAVAARIAPVASVVVVDANAPREFLTGEAVYQQVCAACHTAGVAGAPRTGDQAAWAPLVSKGAEGYAVMLQSALLGKGAMPPKGGAVNLSDYEIARAVTYMANQSGGQYDEPPAPVPEGEVTITAAPAAASAASSTAPAVPAVAAEAAIVAVPVAAAVPAATPPQPAAPASAQITISPEAQTVGKKLHDTACVVCHATGVAGAPRTGDKAAWAPYIATGMDAMLAVAIKGKGAMPPRGTAMSASDDELRLAIEYMVSQSQ